MKSRAWSTAESATRTESVRMYVISPTGPSAPTSTPSYSCCAIRIVIAAEKPSCFAASCCSVLVRNGGGAGGRRSPLSPLVTREGSLRASAPMAWAAAASLISGLWASSLWSRARDGWPSFFRAASAGPYSCGPKRRGTPPPAREGGGGGAVPPPPRRETRLDALPQERRRLVAHQPVEHAPRLLRVHLALVDLQGVCERLPDGVLRDLVEQHPADVGAVAQGLRHVPRDRLALAVGVGGDQHALRLLRRLLDLGESLRLLLDGDVLRREAVLDVHAQLALRQVAHVPHRGLHGVARAEVLADRLRLGR